ncbi:hypothetical protein EV182_002305, partial [Spiromyces aspiralis]
VASGAVEAHRQQFSGHVIDYHGVKQAARQYQAAKAQLFKQRFCGWVKCPESTERFFL